MSKPNTPIKLAFVIPVRNNATSSLRMLNELFHQINAHPQGKSVRVIVVDDASDDETRIVLPRVMRGHGAYLRHETRIGAGGSRNEGKDYALKSVAAEYTAFLDADDFLAPDAVAEILRATQTDADSIMWGFHTLTGKDKDIKWLPKFRNLKDDWCKCPVAPWIHATKTALITPFPEFLTTDDVIWWIRQADVLASYGATFAAIEKVLYFYDKTAGGCTRASGWLADNPRTLEQLACENILIERGLPDRYVSDCLRNLAEMYDLRNTLQDERVREVWKNRFHQEVSGLMTGRFGW